MTKHQDVVTALQESRLLNPEITLRQLAVAAQRIPGLGEGESASWELVTKDFVFRGLPDGGGVIDETIVSSLQESAILNFDVTLGEIIAAGSRLGDAGVSASWELISKDFVLRGLPAPELGIGEV